MSLLCRAIALAVVVVVGVTPLPALAQPSASDLKLAEGKALEAKAYFKQGLYREAAETFMEAFAISKRPDMVFNAARAYEEAKQYARAVALFEQYVALPDAPADGKADARERVARLRPLLEAQRPEPAEPAPSPTPSPSPVGPSGPVGTRQTAPPPSRADVVGWTAFGVGAAGVATGAAFWAIGYTKAKSANDMAIANQDDVDAYNRQFDKAESWRTGAWVSAGAGAVLAGWGAYRLWISPRRASTATTWLVPAIDLASGTGGLAWGGRF